MTWLTYIGAFFWGFVLLASFAGYGQIVAVGLRWRGRDGGLAIAWGLSLLIVGGGVLNLFQWISAPLLVGLVVAGVAAWASLGGPRGLITATRELRSWECLMFPVLILGYVNWLCYSQRPEPGKPPGTHALIQDYDDSPYTLFPTRMLQTGSIGIDPFSDRLTASALGGESFLHALVLAVLPIEYIHLADPGLAYLAMGVMILTMSGLTAFARLTLALLFATHPTASFNASAVAVPVVLLIAIARALVHPRAGHAIGLVVAVALPLAAVLTLKSTLIPSSILLVFLWGVILALLTRRIGPILIGSAIGLLTLFLLLPWMTVSYQSAGTLLYPFLGEGLRRHSLIAFPHKELALTPDMLFKKLALVAIKPQLLVILIGVTTALFLTFLRALPLPTAQHCWPVVSVAWYASAFMRSFSRRPKAGVTSMPSQHSRILSPTAHCYGVYPVRDDGETSGPRLTSCLRYPSSSMAGKPSLTLAIFLRASSRARRTDQVLRRENCTVSPHSGRHSPFFSVPLPPALAAALRPDPQPNLLRGQHRGGQPGTGYSPVRDG